MCTHKAWLKGFSYSRVAAGPRNDFLAFLRFGYPLVLSCLDKGGSTVFVDGSLKSKYTWHAVNFAEGNVNTGFFLLSPFLRERKIKVIPKCCWTGCLLFPICMAIVLAALVMICMVF